jgi:hypothetical protein
MKYSCYSCSKQVKRRAEPNRSANRLFMPELNRTNPRITTNFYLNQINRIKSIIQYIEHQFELIIDFKTIIKQNNL